MRFLDYLKHTERWGAVKSYQNCWHLFASGETSPKMYSKIFFFLFQIFRNILFKGKSIRNANGWKVFGMCPNTSCVLFNHLCQGGKFSAIVSLFSLYCSYIVHFDSFAWLSCFQMLSNFWVWLLLWMRFHCRMRCQQELSKALYHITVRHRSELLN